MNNKWPIETIRSVEWVGESVIDSADFRQIGETLDAFWEYPGNPGDHPYHALLKSGLHSNGFINCSTMLAETNICEMLGAQMINLVGAESLLRRLPFDKVDVVVGPGNAAITISYEVARQLRARHGFTEKDAAGSPTLFGSRMQIRPGERVLIVNELMTTGSGSTYECLQAVRKHQPEADFLPYAVVMVKRSADEMLVDGTLVIPMFCYDIANYEPDKCPYCAAGSMAIKPKVSPENWAKLTGKVA